MLLYTRIRRAWYVYLYVMSEFIIMDAIGELV